MLTRHFIISTIYNHDINKFIISLLCYGIRIAVT